MSIAGKYLNRELLGVFLMVLLVLLLVAVGGRFIGFLQGAAIGKYSAGSLLLLLGLRLPEIVQLLLPFALFVAVLLTLGRLYAEQELAVLLGGGASTAHLLRWLAPLTLVVALLVGLLATSVTPRSNAALVQQLVSERLDRDFANLSPGVFHVYAGGDRVSYADAVIEDGAVLESVFLSERGGGSATATVRAEQGSALIDEKTGSRFLLLERGSRYEGRIGERGYRVVEFQRMGQRIAVNTNLSRNTDVGAMSGAELLAMSGGPAAAELGWRWSLPVLTLVSVLIAAGIARVKPRQGRFAKLLPGLGVFVGYYLALTLVQNQLLESRWPPELGYWPVHIGFILFALWRLGRFGHPQRT